MASGATTITATINTQAVASTAPSITVTPGPVSRSLSTMSVSPTSTPVGTATTVILTARDAGGNPFPGVASMAFFVAAGSTTGGTFSRVTNMGNGVYTATFTGAAAGAAILSATINRLPLTSALPSLIVTPVVTVSTANLAANGTSLVIHGHGFSATAARNTVTFGGVTGKVTRATATTLTVTGLSGLATGTLTATVTSNAESARTPCRWPP